MSCYRLILIFYWRLLISENVIRPVRARFLRTSAVRIAKVIDFLIIFITLRLTAPEKTAISKTVVWLTASECEKPRTCVCDDYHYPQYTRRTESTRCQRDVYHCAALRAEYLFLLHCCLRAYHPRDDLITIIDKKLYRASVRAFESNTEGTDERGTVKPERDVNDLAHNGSKMKTAGENSNFHKKNHFEMT